MNLFAKADWAKNAKYILWAAKIIKIAVFINILIAVVGLCALIGGATIIPGDTNIPQKASVLSVGSFIFSVFIGNFIMYTAARGLELFADLAERIMTTSEKPTTEN
jgi:hypothetical protein